MGEPTPTIGWRRRDDDGMIVVWDLPSGDEAAPMLDAATWKAIEAVEKKWGPLCREIGGRHGLRPGWLQAMIWRESGGNAGARNPEGTPDPKNDGIGLLQITDRGLKGGRTDEALFDPRTNLEIGASHISWLASLPTVKADFPRIAAAFNAGSVRPSTANRWGMHSTGNHIDAEVRALNTWLHLQIEGDRIVATQAQAVQFSAVELLDGKKGA